MRGRRPGSLLAAAAILLSGCGLPSAALDPAGPQAERLAGLGDFFTIVSGVVYAVVLAFLLAALGRRRSTAELARSEDHRPGAARSPVVPRDLGVERRLTRWVVAGIAATTVVLLAAFAASLVAERAIGSLDASDSLEIRLTGNQWWWEVEYPDSPPIRAVTTANEMHVPVGRTVRVRTTSRDVIHSFWPRRLHGKRDLIPARVTEHRLRADRPGVYRAPCAEFCGAQHAKMTLLVVAEPEARFQAWLERQRRPAGAPVDSLARRGRTAFLGGPCALCHTIRGTDAGGRTGPDLTHVGSRLTLAAGTLPNTRGHLAGWIADPQNVKPGTRMPPVALGARELRAIVAYLEGLK
jgi:cytochrome c oxidase subunit 2